MDYQILHLYPDNRNTQFRHSTGPSKLLTLNDPVKISIHLQNDIPISSMDINNAVPLQDQQLLNYKNDPKLHYFRS